MVHGLIMVFEHINFTIKSQKWKLFRSKLILILWGGFNLEYGDLKNGNLESRTDYLEFNLETQFWVTL